MTVEQFYYGPCRLAVAFKRMHRIKREQANFDAYMQGAYTYEAILRASPAFNHFSKNAKPIEWMDRPYDLYGDADDRQGKMDAGKAKEKKNKAAVAFMEAFMAEHNAKFAKKRESMGDEPASMEQETTEAR